MLASEIAVDTVGASLASVIEIVKSSTSDDEESYATTVNV